MVSYQTWTSITFEVATQKGAQFENISDSAVFIQDVAAPIWKDRPGLKTATRAEARQVAQSEISVR